MPIHVTGNPRSDMLRPELRPFYEPEVQRLRAQYGPIILVNTNFNHVNAFSPVQNLFQPPKRVGQSSLFGKAAVGMSRAYAEGLRDHKQAILDAFTRMIPMLDRAFPNHTVIIRPHPTESPKIYRDIAVACRRVEVTNEGNVVPWLMAADVLIHNGCTTGVEAYVMRVPAVSYRAEINAEYDLGFYRLPNLLSHQCFDADQLQEMVTRILKGDVGAANGEDRRELLADYLTAQDGALACERLVEVLDRIVEARPELPAPAVHRRVLGWLLDNRRRLSKRIRKYFSGKHAPEEFHRHRYPGISLSDMKARVARLQHVLNDRTPIAIARISDKIFSLGPE
jgi:hypothetical protein